MILANRELARPADKGHIVEGSGRVLIEPVERDYLAALGARDSRA